MGTNIDLNGTDLNDINIEDNQALFSQEDVRPLGVGEGYKVARPYKENGTLYQAHNYDNDSRTRIKFLKDMVGFPIPDSFDPHEISWVLPNLGVTGAEGAEEAIDKGHFVINVADELVNEATVKMPIEPSNQVWGMKRSCTVLPTLESIVNMMNMVMATEQKVVVHCSMGMERSILATVWYLVRNKGMDLDNAYSFVRSVRPIATDRREWLVA